MLNIDGVVHGNNRCSLAGVDLNRQWKRPRKGQHPPIYHATRLITGLGARLALYVDLHGHSRRNNMFMFGCDGGLGSAHWVETRLLPRMLANSLRFFSYDDCDFAARKNKAGTARVALWKVLGIPHVYTLEASFGGTTTAGLAAMTHFASADYKAMGAGLCDTLLDLFDPDQTVANAARAQLRAMHPVPAAATPSSSTAEPTEATPVQNGKGRGRARSRRRRGNARLNRGPHASLGRSQSVPSVGLGRSARGGRSVRGGSGGREAAVVEAAPAIDPRIRRRRLRRRQRSADALGPSPSPPKTTGASGTRLARLGRPPMVAGGAGLGRLTVRLSPPALSGTSSVASKSAAAGRGQE